ncbi:MAG TPA: hypothetical protein DCP91_05915 [Eggerthellaceae bacterium]|nr:hypothetical protein [Eggerthellaceae bacterium]
MFKSVLVNGMTVEWTGGQDICPDELYYGCVQEGSGADRSREVAQQHQ